MRFETFCLSFLSVNILQFLLYGFCLSNLVNHIQMRGFFTQQEDKSDGYPK